MPTAATLSTLGPPGHEKTVAVGVTLARPGGPAPNAMIVEWYECRFDQARDHVRRRGSAHPVRRWTHYELPNGTSRTSNEDLAGHISLVGAGRGG